MPHAYPAVGGGLGKSDFIRHWALTKGWILLKVCNILHFNYNQWLQMAVLILLCCSHEVLCEFYVG